MVVGTVYKIFSEQGDKFYVGSTTAEVKKRFQQHKNSYLLFKVGKKVKHLASFDLFDLYGADKCKWIRLKVIEVADSTHLKAYEQLYMNRLKCDNMINKRLALDFMKGKCEHQRLKYRCVECRGSSVCIHNRVKGRCRECGTGLCIHNRIKQCKDCKTGYCLHEKQINHCFICSPYTCAVCNTTMIKSNKTRHEKSAKHIRNSQN